MKQNKYLNLVGLAFRAKKCSIGEEQIVRDIQHKQAKLVLIAEDIGKSTFKKITDKCKTYEVPYVTVDSRDVLSHAIGQTGRVAVAILDEGFAKKLKTLL
ncbi:MAG TPA: YlxQ family RNA-binding protein [Bacillota bacterium]|nr:YlxQ family RNA-binding protein [Bacillota bacterium]